jgi:hypothetical protein
MTGMGGLRKDRLCTINGAAMPISLLTLGDAEISRSLQRWGDEFAYAMGAKFDFGRADYGRSETIVLHIVCLPPAWGGIGSGTALKRSSSEFWSTYKADYAAFSSGSAEEKISAVAAAITGAVQQIPERRMPSEVKEEFRQAAEMAATTLLAQSGRHPR